MTNSLDLKGTVRDGGAQQLFELGEHLATALAKHMEQADDPMARPLGGPDLAKMILDWAMSEDWPTSVENF